MGALGEFNIALLNAANTVNNVMSDFAKRKSDFQLTTNSINFQEQLNSQLNSMEKTDGWRVGADGTSQWEKDIDTWYQDKMDSLTDESSPYFAHNNYEYKSMQKMLQKSRIAAKDKISQMAWQKQGEQMIVDYNNGLQQLKGMFQGQDYINVANERADELLKLGLVSPQQYDNLIKTNFTTGYFDYYANQLDVTMDQAIKDGKTFDSLYNEIVTGKDDMKLYGSDKLEIKVDKEVINAQLKKVEEQKYNAKVSQMQLDNYKDHEQRFNKIDDKLLDILNGNSSDVQSIYNECNIGLAIVGTQNGLQLGKGEQTSISDKYVRYFDTLKDFEKSTKSGSGSNSTSSFVAFIKNAVDTFAQAVAEGRISNLIEAEKALQKVIYDEYYSRKTWTETKGMNEQEIKDYYNLNFSNSAASHLLNDEKLNKIAKEKYPDQYAYFENQKKEIVKDMQKKPEDRIYQPNTLATMTSFLLDSAAENTDPAEFSKKWDSMLKACTIQGLNGMFEKRHILESENNKLIRDIDEMYSNDIVHLTVNNEEVWAGGENAKAKYDEVSKNIKSYIEQNLDGVSLSQPTYRKTKYDIEPIPEFRGSDGNTYHLETEQNGKKKIPVIVDQNGKRYSGKNLAAEDKAAKKASKQNIKDQKQALFEEEEKAAQETEDLLMNTSKIPSKVAASGAVEQQDWDDTSNNTQLRYYQMNAAIGEIDKMASNKKVSDEEFKRKFGLSKKEWQDMQGQTRRYKYLMS